MAEANITSTTLKNFGSELNQFGALLHGIEDICEAEDISGDALHVAATVCRQINRRICEIADRLSHIADEFKQEGGAA